MLLNHCRLYAPLSGGFAGEDCCVELDGGKITAVGPARPDTAEAFDCGGQTLLPGLIDLHTHITFLRNVGVAQAHDPMQLVVEAAAQADRYLRHGFTTIRDCGSIRRSANYVRQLIDRGLMAGPDILACGQTLMPSVTASTGVGDITHYCDGAEEFRKAVREEVAAQADFIKIYASGSAFSPTGVPKHPIMTFDEI